MVENLILELMEKNGTSGETRAILQTNAEEPIEGFSAEYTFATS